MTFKSIREISQEKGISRITLIARAKVLKLPMVGRQYIISKEDEKRLLDPSLHKVGKPSQKTPNF